MSTLIVRWQRLVNEEGRTCDRCGTTERAVDDAIRQLQRSLKELNIDVVLEKTTLSPATFAKDTLESNRIWIAGEPIEKWLSATSGKSQCCSACGDSDCRTLSVEGNTYEAIPTELIVQAGLLASAQILQGRSRESCCPTPGSQRQNPEPCSPSSDCRKK